MNEELEDAPSNTALIAHLYDHVAILSTFAVAVARSHPNPEDLLSAFERTIAEDEEGEIPYAELTPDNRKACEDRHIQRDMLLRVIRSRLSS